MAIRQYEVDFARAERLMRLKTPKTSEAYKILVQLSDADFGPAQYALATWYIHGLDKIIKPNIRKAVSLLRKSADKNYPNACYDLAVAYEKGTGVKASIQKAMQYYTKAALLGDVEAMHELGRIYYHGVGVQKNRGLAWVWLDEERRLKK
jgi:uncharacterized protein